VARRLLQVLTVVAGRARAAVPTRAPAETYPEGRRCGRTHTAPVSGWMEVGPLTPADARAIATWRYPGRYATYDEVEVPSADRGYWAVHHDGKLVGSCCFGDPARVPGVVEEPGILDVGYGMRPDLMGQGLGRSFIGAILEFGDEEFSPRRFRLLILEWNGRSRAAARSAGFEEDGAIRSTDGAFVVMTRDAPAAAHGGLEEGLPMSVRAVVLVEGLSDRLALEALAVRRGRDLSAEGISIVDVGGAKNMGASLDRFGPRGMRLAIAGLFDAAEEPDIRRALERAGFGSNLSLADMERLGFYACVEDLEDELIRALGAETVLGIVEARGELTPFRTLQKQPEWRGRPVGQQLRRFLGNASRKIGYAATMVEALDQSNVPRPLAAVLTHV
jgi:RimJ/RimL family protein N-acetyltransferase